MSQSKTAAAPLISSLDPDAVKREWEGAMNVHGSGFDNGSFALIDGAVPRTTYKSSTLLEASLTREITGTAGKKVVKVHTGSGDVSNEKTLTVA